MTEALRPVCFMVMPYRVKDVPGPPRPGVPATLDCDALWERIYKPALEQLGYQAVRGDSDPSSVILNEMIERLAFADLVVADVTLPNGNVYYEVGLRHVARDTHCVLAAADWAQPLFDISTFSSIRFPLTDGVIDADEAARARDILMARVPALRDVRTPYHTLVGDGDEARRRGVFRDQVTRIDAFQAGAREVRLMADAAARAARVRALRAATTGSALEIAEVAVELLTLVRDHVGWDDALAFIDTLPPATRALPFVEEQRLLALAKHGDPLQAIGGLEALIRDRGDTPERRGLIGGRCKALWLAARAAREAAGTAAPSLDERRWLTKAIESYEAGMALDLNQYYCASNLERLLAARGAPGDRERAATVNAVVREQCKRLLARADADPWLRPTLLAAAIRGGDVDEARRLVEQVAMDGAAAWQVATTLTDMDEDLRQLPAGPVRDAMQQVRDELATLA
jgi:hypothetical protein